MKVYYVANAYMPHEKAYGIQIAKMCEALIEEGVDLTLVVPSHGPQSSLREFYGLRVDIPTIWLPTLDLVEYERFGYACMALSFSLSYIFFVLYRWLRRERFILYTIDTDWYSSSALALMPAPLFSEMHGAKRYSLPTRILFWRIRGSIAINRIIVDELQKMFPRSPARYIAEPNGVDLALFAPQDKLEARTRLALPLETKTVLYAGRFYEWKGLEIIPRAAALSPEIRWQIVGGTREQFTAVVKDPLPANLHFAGGRPHSEMPVWIAAADAVLVLGTKRDEQSYRWTSPMKLFEYMAAGRPIVASATPAIKEAISLQEALLYEPDDAKNLADTVRKAVIGGASVTPLVSNASCAAQALAWSGRAKRVVRFIESVINEPLS